jgi:DNA-binding HxlR family transcriptional regulator
MSSRQATNSKEVSARRAAVKPDPALCPQFHRAVELIGRRWTGAVIQLLLAGPGRFNELLAAIPGLSDRLLSTRLRELEAEGVVLRVVTAGPPVRVEYALSASGKALEPALTALGEWAHRFGASTAQAAGKRMGNA